MSLNSPALVKINSPEEARKYIASMGIVAMEVLYTRLAQDPNSSSKMLLDFADTALKAGDLYPKASTGLLTAGAGATINFHFSRPPPNQLEKDVTFDHEPPPHLPEAPKELHLAAMVLNKDLCE